MTTPINIEVGKGGGDQPVARIQSGADVLAEVAGGDGSMDVVLHPRRDGSPWTLGCNELEDLLRQAKLRLVRA